MEKIVN